MLDNIRFLLVHTCDVQRPDTDVNISVIRDRHVAKYDTVASAAACWFDPTSVNYVFNDQLGQVPIKSFTVYFVGGTNIREGDRLKKTVSGTTTYYLVKQVQDYSDQGMHIVTQVEEKKYAMAPP